MKQRNTSNRAVVNTSKSATSVNHASLLSIVELRHKKAGRVPLTIPRSSLESANKPSRIPIVWKATPSFSVVITPVEFFCESSVRGGQKCVNQIHILIPLDPCKDEVASSGRSTCRITTKIHKMILRINKSIPAIVQGAHHLRRRPQGPSTPRGSYEDNGKRRIDRKRNLPLTVMEPRQVREKGGQK